MFSFWSICQQRIGCLCLCWSTIYPGHPNTIRVDQRSHFTGLRWQKNTEDNGILLKLTGIESHSSIGLGERYRAPLRRIYSKMRHSSPSVLPAMVLRLAQKAMNDTTGPSGLVPSLLVFGVMPRLLIVNPRLLDQVARMKALTTARTEMNTIVAELRVRQALRARIPTAANYILTPGQKGRIFREGDKKFIGPFTIVSVDSKQVFVDRNGKRAQYNISQVIPEHILSGRRTNGSFS